MPEVNYSPDPRTLPEVQFVPDLPADSGSGQLVGVGSPEGVTTGREGQHYWDSLNRTEYIKTSAGTGNTGWEIFLGI